MAFTPTQRFRRGARLAVELELGELDLGLLDIGTDANGVDAHAGLRRLAAFTEACAVALVELVHQRQHILLRLQAAHLGEHRGLPALENGRASCRERVCQYV